MCSTNRCKNSNMSLFLDRKSTWRWIPPPPSSTPLSDCSQPLNSCSGFAGDSSRRMLPLLSVFLQDSASSFVYAAFGLLSAAEFMLWIRRRLIEEDAAAER
ncbi:hypothetical protein SASPL_146740 [Salvia splendens]|uniref:Uncharacterized protein n=1 Tax=Salvia splendens TaxID=180675 RepID=A0A8X8Z5V4_SALSN|nr:hypothetical protein SASPL_146740 [Salvia splendens]